MADPVTANLCRLVIHGPERDFEITVPTGVEFAELLPVIVKFAGKDLDEVGLDHDGWVLQRLGEEPIDEDATAAAVGLRDGDALYLRARREQLPPIHFDDLVDGVAGALRDRADAWRPAYTHHLLAVLCLGALAGGLLLLWHGSWHGDLPAVRASVAGGVGVLLVVGAGVASRALGDALGAAALGAAAVPYVAFAGALVPAGSGSEMDGARLLAAGTAGAAAAALALAAAATAAPILLSAVLLGVLSAVGGLSMMYGSLDAVGAASVAAGLLVVFGGFVPVLSFQFAGMRLPPLPADAAQLQEGIEPHPGREVLSRTKVADQYMTAIYAASGLAAFAILTVLGHGRGWAVWSTGGVFAALLLLHGRGLAGGMQRLSVVLPGAYGAILLPLAATWDDPLRQRLTVLGALIAGGIVLISAAWAVPGRRVLPYWGRIADIVQATCALGLIPLILFAAGVYARVRGTG